MNLLHSDYLLGIMGSVSDLLARSKGGFLTIMKAIIITKNRIISNTVVEANLIDLVFVIEIQWEPV